MSDEEIVKSLEQCVKCGNRNYETDIVLDLINRQKEQIEELKERFTLDFEKMESEYDCKIKVEAYKEFAEKLKEKSFQSFGNYGITRDVVEVCDIDNLLKEMVGEIK